MLKKIFRKYLLKFDRRYETISSDTVYKIYFDITKILNFFRRKISFTAIRSAYKIGIKNNYSLRLHLGCGEAKIKGYINIDLRKTIATDLVCDIAKLPYPDNSLIIIENYHVIEHLPRNKVNVALKEWFRVLKPGGTLVIECPDFDELARKYLEGDEKQLDGIFALQRFEGDYHYFGYNASRLKKALKDIGFTNIEEMSPKDYHIQEWDCIRVECIKDSDG